MGRGLCQRCRPVSTSHTAPVFPIDVPPATLASIPDFQNENQLPGGGGRTCVLCKAAAQSPTEPRPKVQSLGGAKVA